MRRFLLCLLMAMVAGTAAASPTRAAHLSGHALPATARRLFTVGIQGGFTGAIMRATVYADGQVLIARQGAGRPLHDEQKTLPISLTAVAAARTLARQQKIYAIPKSVQQQTFGADVPILVLTVYSGGQAKTVQATGSERNHVPGTGKFFPVWGLFYALAGYPSQVG